MSNSQLHKAKKEKNDEFYTQYVDIEKELQHYNIEGKTIYCNCDNPHYSNFYKYFKDKFNTHKIKHLYCTGYNKDGNGYYAEYNGTEETIKTLNGNGSFESDECINILKIADVIITNPPFSLFRDYVKQLMDYKKQFLIIGNMNAVTYKEIFPYIKANQLWWGASIHSGDRKFYVPDNYPLNAATCGVDENGERFIRVKGIRWWTNIDHIKPNKSIILTKTYNPIDYPHFDNYDAINVDKVKDIPIDYDGVMGVPITFLDKYCPSQFEILDARNYTSVDKLKNKSTFLVKDKDSAINGKPTYARILIKKNDSLEPVEFEIIGITENADYLKSLYINGCQKYDRPYINGKRIYSRLLIKMR